MKKGDKKRFLVLGLVLALAIFVSILLSNSTDEGMENVETFEIGDYSVVSGNVNYYENVEGYLAEPDSEGNYPGVVMIHEWWGLNENIKQMADNLASQGYVVLAVDLYNGEVAESSDRAGELSGSVRESPDEAIENMNSAIDYLKNMENTEKVGSLGWCFGGQQSLQVSLNNSENLDATVIYYGNLVTDTENLSRIDQPVLGVFGSEDSVVPLENVREFNSSLGELGIENEIYVYEGVGHAFANPSNSGHDAEKTKDAWDKTLDFLDRSLKG